MLFGVRLLWQHVGVQSNLIAMRYRGRLRGIGQIDLSPRVYCLFQSQVSSEEAAGCENVGGGVQPELRREAR
jgi:hypothetical protein